MKNLKELRKLDLKLSSTGLYFSQIKDLSKRKLDMDVFLPSKGVNLQRERVWTLQQKKELIMSIFIDRTIPHICVMSIIDDKDKSENGKYDDILQIIDGKQRLCTFLDFLNNDFTIEMEDNEMGGRIIREYFFNQLPDDYQHAFLFYEIKSQVAYEPLEKRFTDEDKIDWFKRINYFGTPQDKEHLILIEKGAGSITRKINTLLNSRLNLDNGRGMGPLEEENN